MFHRFKKIFNKKDKSAVQQQQGFDVRDQSTTTLTIEERRKLQKAAHITVKQYGGIIEQLSREWDKVFSVQEITDKIKHSLYAIS